MTPLHLAFLAAALFSVYVQARCAGLEWSLREDGQRQATAAERERWLRIRRVTSPALAAWTALLVALGAFVWPGGSAFLGGLLTAIWLCAALGDIFVEGSYSTHDPERKARFHAIGMVLFVAVTLGLGLGLVLHAWREGPLGPSALSAAAAVSAAGGLAAHRTLPVEPGRRTLTAAYAACVSTLLWGGVNSALAGFPRLAAIGIAWFASDWLVGLRDFDAPLPRRLRDHLLLPILLLYYGVMLLSIDAVVWPRP